MGPGSAPRSSRPSRSATRLPRTRCCSAMASSHARSPPSKARSPQPATRSPRPHRSEEHTSELQSHLNLVCRLLLEKKKKDGDSPKLHDRHTLRITYAPLMCL